ncbi:conserved hypothetical protein [Gammaproteobacteria bacterium]
MVGKQKNLARLLRLPQKHSLFLFGARGTGKSTLLQQLFLPDNCLWLNLLDPEQEARFAINPKELSNLVLALSKKTTHVIIDEVQKVPKLLDVVHFLCEKTKKSFVLTGSSARKLKFGGSNLLAGRAFVYNLFPFSFLELQDQFNLNSALQWGLLPKVVFLKTNEEKQLFLQAYATTYLKEEIWGEHFIRRLDPFRKFLEVAAQCNAKIINYANIAHDTGVDDKTIKEYFGLLEDTLIGFFLEPFKHLFRKRLSAKPKFYFFDCGVVRALGRSLSVPLTVSTSVYGEAFEHFVILECVKLAAYFKPEYRFSYLRTKDDLEVDLVVERPGKLILFIEIKSSSNVQERDLSQLRLVTRDFKMCESVCFSQDSQAKQFDCIRVMPWRDGILKFFSKG